MKKTWYRAEWLSHPKAGHSLVYLVDLGEEHTVPNSNLRLLLERFGNDAALAVKAGLAGLPARKDALLREDLIAILTSPGCEVLTADVASPSPAAILDFNKMGKHHLTLPLLLKKKSLERLGICNRICLMLLGLSAGRVHMVEIDKQQELQVKPRPISQA